MANTTPQQSPHASSEFPNFHNGDVMVVIHANEIYQLHSDVFRRCSPEYLGLLVAQSHAAQLVRAAVNGGCFTRYKLVLEPSEACHNGVFRRKVCLLYNCNSKRSYMHLLDSRHADNQIGSR